MTLLDYNKEFQGAIKGLNQTGNAIQVKRVHATLHKFTLCLTENPVGLHFSGHGIENSVKTVGKQNYFLHNQGNCLVFETENGVAHFISEK